jgi:ribosomal protein S18 acetylase RimI-like enzyme
MNVLDWDSDFFGRRIGRAGPDEELDAAVTAAERAGVECLYLERDGADVAGIGAAVARGACLVDLRLVFQRDEPPPVPADAVRTAGAADAGPLRDAAVSLSAASRFRADPRFPSGRVDELYRRWLDRCLAEGVVVVPAEGYSGFVGARLEAGVGHLDLVWVDAEASGRGLGRTLVAGALAALGASAARVVTQAGNVPAQHLYQSLGFRTRSCTAILHLWLPTNA